MSNEKPIPNAADEKQLKDKSQRDFFDQQRLDNAWKAVMASDQGMDVLMEILRFCKLESCPADAGGADREIFSRLGRQKVGRFVKKRMIDMNRRKYFETELKLGEA